MFRAKCGFCSETFSFSKYQRSANCEKCGSPNLISALLSANNLAKCGGCETILNIPIGATVVKCGECQRTIRAPSLSSQSSQSSLSQSSLSFQQPQYPQQQHSPPLRAQKPPPPQITPSYEDLTNQSLSRPTSASLTSPLSGTQSTSRPTSSSLGSISSRASGVWNVNDVNLQGMIIPFESLQIGKEIYNKPHAIAFEGIWQLGKTVCTRIKTEELKVRNLSSLQKLGEKNSRLYKIYGGSFDSNNRLYLVTEHCPLTDLRSILREGISPISLAVRLTIALQISEGMEALESRGIVHGCLTPSSVFLWEFDCDRFAHIQLKINDYFYEWQARFYSETKQRWLSPEVLNGEPLTTASDAWAFGITIWSLFSGELPYSDSEGGDDFQSLIKSGKYPRQPHSCPDQLYLIIKQCWNQTPRLRPSFADLRAKLWELVVQSTSSGSFQNPSQPKLKSTPSQPLATNQREWNCKMCTYLNKSTDTTCEMCSTKK
eukprot:c15407_g2_i1.p1 GENE.c15407_g2_i1~~c15407_g2_i1.p1  ORF type:complete len:557 (-),score=195.08 c15407_g2_i1:29-1492(-)